MSPLLCVKPFHSASTSDEREVRTYANARKCTAEYAEIAEFIEMINVLGDLYGKRSHLCMSPKVKILEAGVNARQSRVPVVFKN